MGRCVNDGGDCRGAAGALPSHDLLLDLTAEGPGSRLLRLSGIRLELEELLKDGSSMADIRGVMFQGHARIVREPSEALQLAREGARARGVPEPEWPTAPRPGAAYIRMTPVRTVSWDYATSTPDQA